MNGVLGLVGFVAGVAIGMGLWLMTKVPHPTTVQVAGATVFVAGLAVLGALTGRMAER